SRSTRRCATGASSRARRCCSARSARASRGARPSCACDARGARRTSLVKVAWLFPGQGSQEVGMGKALAESSTAARDVYRVADEALGSPISRLCFEGPMEELTLTANTQPALVATSSALVAALRQRWPDLPAPAFAAGHSLGEYSALVAAGSLDLADAV